MAVPEPHRSVVLVDTCLGLIENGGVEYLFEAELPHCPTYQQIAQAFRNCGADHAAALLEQIASLLPGSEPHLYPAERQAFMASPTVEFVRAAEAANKAFWSDTTIAQGVAEYARRGATGHVD